VKVALRGHVTFGACPQPNSAEEGWTMHMVAKTKVWTLEEVHSLPDDGNKYELVRGELFVTPPPTFDHETIAARLTRLLDPFVATHQLGFIYHPKAVMRFEGSEVEPDLMVRQPGDRKATTWDNAPVPILVVEVLSPSTRRRDHGPKRELYLDAAVAEYWIVDPDRQEIRSIRANHDDRVERARLTWSPPGVTQSLTIELREVFG
jgi:Uma2 family endonuclease